MKLWRLTDVYKRQAAASGSGEYNPCPCRLPVHPERETYSDTAHCSPPAGQSCRSVSYTHLDVYKRQQQIVSIGNQTSGRCSWSALRYARTILDGKPCSGSGRWSNGAVWSAAGYYAYSGSLSGLSLIHIFSAWRSALRMPGVSSRLMGPTRSPSATKALLAAA